MGYKMLTSKWYGNEPSDYAKKMGFLDMATYFKPFNMVYNSDVLQWAYDWELVNGYEYSYKHEFEDVELTEEEYQELDYDEQYNFKQEYFTFDFYYIIDYSAFIDISETSDNTIWYSEEKNLYVLGLNGYGTSWDYQLTDIELAK